jgi:hypothetical protein
MRSIHCRSCGDGAGDIVLDLGMQPACEYFPPIDATVADPVFPLRLWLCASCGLAQLADDADLPDQPEGLEPAALVHQRRAAVAAVQVAGLLPDGGTVVEGATPHGGTWRAELEHLGLRFGETEPADVVVDGSFGLMHASDQAAALDALVGRLAPDGVLIFQFHSLAAMLRERQWNAVRLGHYAYYSLPALQHMLAVRGLTVTHAWTFRLYGGTVMIAARRGGTPDPSVAEIVSAEVETGVLDSSALQKLQECVDLSTASLRRLVEDARAAGEQVYAYSAASRAVALVYLAGVQHDLLLGVADASPGKHGCRMPGTGIPVVSPEQLVAARPDIVVLFVADLLPEVRAALPEIEMMGGRWVDAETRVVQSRA